MGAIMALLAVVISIVVAAAIFTSLDVFLALSTAKVARGRKPGYFNIGYKPGYDRKFYRAHLVGVIERIGNRMLYLVEIHPEDAAKARAWTVRKAELCGRQLLKKGRFYRYASKEELNIKKKTVEYHITEAMHFLKTEFEKLQMRGVIFFHLFIG